MLPRALLSPRKLSLLALKLGICQTMLRPSKSTFVLGLLRQTSHPRLARGTARCEAHHCGVEADLEYKLSLIFIHGLTGDREDTWTARSAAAPWPSRLLPARLPNVRILTFGYDAFITNLRGMVSDNRIADHAMNLLNSVADDREAHDTHDRPIIFVCHSLGGLVCEQALVLARQSAEHYLRQIQVQTHGILFMGTPHRGAGLAEWASLLARSVGLVKQTNANIVKVLRRESEVLALMQDNFFNLMRAREQENLSPIQITCIFEELPVPGVGTIVPRESAVIPGHVPISVHQNHMGMTKFESPEDPGFIAVAGVLSRWTRSLQPHKVSLNVAPSSRSLTASEQSYIAAFVHRYSSIDVDERVEGTCSWSTKTTPYISWNQADCSAVLWLTGEAGCGKTVLTSFIIQHLRSFGTDNQAARSHVVYSFFCDRNDEARRDIRCLLRSLIVQILDSRREIVHQIRRSFRADKHEYDHSFETLWNIFQMAIEMVPYDEIYIMVDALDECDDKGRSRLLLKIAQSQAEARPRLNKRVKYMISGHWAVRNAAISATQLHQFHIDIEKRPTGLVQDLLHFIDHRVDELIDRSLCSRSSGDMIRTRLKSLTENSFLWLKIVLDGIKESLKKRYRDADIQRLLVDVPRSLQDAYSRYLPDLPESGVPMLQKYLKLIVACTRPLKVSEIDAFTDLEEHPLGSALPQDETEVIKTSVRRAIGPLVKFPEETVRLVHSTVRDFFVLLRSDEQHPLHITHSVDLLSAHRFCAIACMRYLLDPRLPEDLFGLRSPSSDSFTASPVSPRLPQQNDNDVEENPETGALFHCLFDIQDVGFLHDEDTRIERAWTGISYRFAAFEYAALNWAHHFAQCQRLSEDSDIEDAITLLNIASRRSSSWFKFWVHRSHIEMPASPNVESIVLAALFNHARSVETLFSRGQYTVDDLCLHDALYWAASGGSCDSIKVLLERKVLAQNPKSDKVPLAVAAQGGFLDSCALLLDTPDVDPNKVDQEGRPPILLAAKANHSEILCKLLQHRSIWVDQKDAAGRSALSEACRTGSLECVEVILKDGRFDINSEDSKARTALHYASVYGDDLVVKHLLANHALGIHAKDVNGRTAMSLAAEHGHLHIVRRLSNKSLSAAVQDVHGRNAISWAANSTKATIHSGQSESVLDYLVRKYPEAIDDTDESGWSPLAWALDRPGYFQSVRVLLESGRVDINQRDRTFGRSILAWAASEGFSDIVGILLKSPKIEKNTLSDDGRSPLSYAAANGMFDAVRVLLEDLDVNATEIDPYGKRPVDWARLNNHENIVRLLEARW